MYDTETVRKIRKEMSKRYSSKEVVKNACCLVLTTALALTSVGYDLSNAVDSILKNKRNEDLDLDNDKKAVDTIIEDQELAIASYSLEEEPVISETNESDLEEVCITDDMEEKDNDNNLFYQIPPEVIFNDAEFIDVLGENIIMNNTTKEIVKDALSEDQELVDNINDSVTVELMKNGLIDEAKTNDEKIAWILEHYNLTMDQFKVVVGVTIAEAQGKSYEDAYAVINTIYNRTICSRWVNSVEKYQGKGLGNNLYNQVIQPGQFTVYYYGLKTYQNYLNVTPEEEPGMQAVIDFLYGNFEYDYDNNKITWLGPARLHDLVNFVGQGVTPKYEYTTFTNRGNRYGVSMKQSEYLSDEFTSISEEEVEKKAQEAEALSKEYASYIDDGMSENNALSLVRGKSE